MKDRTKRYTDGDVLKELERRIEARGLRAFAREHAMSPTFVSQVRHCQSVVSERMANALGFVDDGKRWVRR